MASSREVYELVWNRAAFLGAYVHYDRQLAFSGGDRKGFFHPNEETQQPKIHIACVRKRIGTTPKLNDKTPEEIVAELHTLAHETGHFLSWRHAWNGDGEARAALAEKRIAAVRFDEVFNETSKTTSEELPDQEFARIVNANIQRELTERQRELILAEEERAWTLGRELLVEFGYDGLAAYDTRATFALGGYRDQLGFDRSASGSP